MDFDAIIIGGGLGGLTAGAALSHFGKKVLLLEQHYVVGGCATAFKRKDYVMEVGLHEMDGLHDLDIKRQIFDFLRVKENITFLKLPELYRIVSDTIDVVVPHGKSSYLKTLAKQYPEDEQAISRLLDLMDGVLREIPRLPNGWKGKLLLPIMPMLYPNVVKSAAQTVGNWLDKNIKNEELKIILQGNLMYYGDDPYQMSLLYFSVAQSSYIGGGGHYIQGGSQQLSNHLANEISRLGGQVLLGKQVTEIIIQHGRAAGVRFKDTFNPSIPPQQILAPCIIANAAIPLVKTLLPKPQSETIAKLIDGMQEACSLISVYLGFNSDLKKLGVKHYSSFFYGDKVKSLQDVAQLNQGNDWQNKPFVFVDYGQVNSQLCPRGKNFGVICATDYLKHWQGLSADAYKKEKQRVAEIFIDRLAHEIPGIKSHIEYYEVATAKTIQSYTLNPEGTAYGFAQTPKQSGRGRLNAKSPIKNLFFSSAWCNPGGGFTGAIIGGFLSAREANKSIAASNRTQQKLRDERVVPFIDRYEIAANTIELVFEKPSNFNHCPGQYVILSLNHPRFSALDLPHRSLSIVSHPVERHLRFAMRKGHSSFKKSCLALQKGDTATIYGPRGNFRIENYSRPVALLVAGIGITPIPSLLEELKQNQFTPDIHLFYCNRNPEQAAYHALFKQDLLKNFQYHPVYSSIDGHLNMDSLEILGSIQQYDFYIVGGQCFVESMQRLLTEYGVRTEQLFLDDFG